MNKIFYTNDFEHRVYNGKSCEIVRAITEPDDDHPAEILPMYVIRFEDGTTFETWEEKLQDTLTVKQFVEQIERHIEEIRQLVYAFDQDLNFRQSSWISFIIDRAELMREYLPYWKDAEDEENDDKN